MAIQANAFSTIQPVIDRSKPLPKACFTQGLSLAGDSIWLSCGQYNQSKIYQLQAENWHVIQEKSLPQQWFAEGIAEVDGALRLLTWKNQLIASINKKDLTIISTSHFKGEAWGLASTPDHHFILSDGSSIIRWFTPENFDEVRRLNVKANSVEVNLLNELEWVNDKIWANIWLTNTIVIIDPTSGAIERRLDLTNISQHEQNRGGDVLNGIVFIPAENAVYVTGKWWRKAYRIPLSQFTAN